MFLLVPILCFLFVILVVLPVIMLVSAKLGTWQPRKIEKKINRKRITYNDGFGKYTVDVKEEEWI